MQLIKNIFLILFHKNLLIKIPKKYYNVNCDKN